MVQAATTRTNKGVTTTAETCVVSVIGMHLTNTHLERGKYYASAIEQHVIMALYKYFILFIIIYFILLCR